MRNSGNRPRWGGWLLLILLALGVAAYLRFAALAYSEIGPDQSILTLIAMRFVNGGPLPLAANKSSAGIMNPPLIVYLLALPLRLRPLLSSPILFQAALSWGGVALLAWGSQRLFGRRVAALAALLFAVNPWAVHYSRFLWNPNPIPFFATLLLLALFFFLRPMPAQSAPPPSRNAWLSLALLCLAAITQLHLSGLVLLPTVGLILLLYWRQWPAPSWRGRLWPLLLGLGLALLLYLPFLRFEQAVGFGDLQAVFDALVGGRSGVTGAVAAAETNTASLALVLELADGAAVWGAQSVWPAALPDGFFLTTLLRWLFVASLAWAAGMIAWDARRRQPLSPRQLARGGLLLWVLLPVLFYLRHTVYLQNYYFLYIFPAPFLLVALMVDDWLAALARRNWPTMARQGVMAGVLAVVLAIAAWQFLINQTGLRLLQRGEIGPPQTAAQVTAAISVTSDLLARYPTCDLTILSAGGAAESSPLGLVEAFVYPRRARLLETGRGFVMPASCTLYLVTAPDPLAQAWLDTQATPLAPTIPATNGDWHFYYVGGENAGISSPLAAWQNGLQLVQTEVTGAPAANATIQIDLTWLVTETPPPDIHYHFFNHFLDGSGALVTQDDAPAIQTQYWRLGDRLVTRFHLQLPSELPPGPYDIRTGLYIWPDLTRIPLVDSAETTVTIAQFPSATTP